MPLAAPVTMATLSCSFMVESSCRNVGYSGHRGGAFGADQVEDAHAVVLGRAAPGPARVAQRLQDVGVSRGPMLPHGEARELVVLDMILVALRAVDELHDIEAHA